MATDPFVLFCLYYLGLTPEGDYKFLNANQIAGKINCTVDDLMGTLKKNGIHPDTVLNTDFPMARHQVDIQIAASEEAPGQLKARAQGIYEEFLGTVGKKRNWLKEIADEKESERGRPPT